MTATTRRGRLLHLAAALDCARFPGVPGVPGVLGSHDAATPVELARLAEQGGFDFVTLGDSFARPGLDALAVLARIAPATSRIGLVPTVTTTHTEPFQVQAAVATLDWVSRGRAGWQVDVSATGDEARLFGRRAAGGGADELWQRASQVAEAATRLWDSWEDGAEIRDVATGRFVDRDKLHYVDFECAAFAVQGPSFVPRPPQGHPVIVVDATEQAARDTAARHADVALLGVASRAEAEAARTELRGAARAHGRDPDTLRVLARLTVDLGGGEYTAERGHGGGGPRHSAQGPRYRGGPVDLAQLIADWHTSGAVDGFHFSSGEPVRDLERLVNGTVALLQHRGLFRTFYPGSTLRDHLGLARPANRYSSRLSPAFGQGAAIAGGSA